MRLSLSSLVGSRLASLPTATPGPTPWRRRGPPNGTEVGFFCYQYSLHITLTPLAAALTTGRLGVALEDRTDTVQQLGGNCGRNA